MRQCEKLIAATDRALDLALPFNRHWTVHYERAGIAETDAVRFIGHLLKLAGDYARRNGHRFACVWVRENGPLKGGHVHILMHLPAALSLRGKSRKWVRLAGGQYRARVSRVDPIARRLIAAENGDWGYLQNLKEVLGYVLKGANREAADAHGLARFGRRGKLVGKRCGWSQNIGSA